MFVHANILSCVISNTSKTRISVSCLPKLDVVHDLTTMQLVNIFDVFIYFYNR